MKNEKLKGHRLDYHKQDKKVKIQIISYIRKTYNGTKFRDIYNGLHQAICDTDRKYFIGVATDLQMIAHQKSFNS